MGTVTNGTGVILLLRLLEEIDISQGNDMYMYIYMA